MKDIIATDKFIAIYIKIATLFLVRDNDFTYTEADAEINRIIEEFGSIEDFYDSYVNNTHPKFANEAYIMMNRIGLKKKLNRAKRNWIALSLDNAFNHAGFEYYHG